MISYFLFSWNKKYWKFMIYWLLVFLYFYICLKLYLLSPQFHFNQNEVSVLNWKQKFIVFIFWLFHIYIFIENVFKNSIKYIFITIFYFQWKWKQKTTKLNTCNVLPDLFTYSKPSKCKGVQSPTSPTLIYFSNRKRLVYFNIF